MAGEILGATALAHLLEARAVVLHERLHSVVIRAELRAGDVDVRMEAIHYQPQQSVLKRQEGHRQTACMRYISAPQRSHFIASSFDAAGGALSAETIGLTTSGGNGLGEGLSTPAL